MSSLRFSSAALAATLLVAIVPSHAQDALAGRFPFVMPWDDATPGTVTDLASLNAKPAGVNGRVVVKDGHFVEAGTGSRVRFFGMNFTGAANFPTHEEATKIAAHLAKLGFNVVRIHHHDNNGSALWDKNAPGHRVFDAGAVDRLDFLIYSLKQAGIYTNLNLHVSRTFTEADGFPESVKRLPGIFNKRVDNFDRQMIDLQKEFARNYLAHVNPYTKLSYTEDPCIAFVEINNENSLVDWDNFGGRFNYFETLPEPFRGGLLAQWNDWLKRQYGNDGALQVAWRGMTPAKPAAAVLTANVGWKLQNMPGTANLTAGDVAAQALPDVTVTNPQITAEPWHVQSQVMPLNFENGQSYAVSFRARADKARTLPLYTSVVEGDWHNVGLNVKAQLTTDWRDYRYFFQAEKAEADNNRLSFVMGNDSGTVWLSNVRIEPAGAAVLVPENQSLAAGTVGVPSGGTALARADWIRFLVETERGYCDEMLHYLRDDLKVKANLIDSQIAYGELSSFYREANSDFTDEHAYWQHPEFPGRQWDGNNWTMGQNSMVTAMAGGNPQALVRIALHRVAGKPYTVSEYCVPAPNDYQAEMYPVLASYAALQDWDAIYHFDYGNYGAAVPAGKIQSFFSLSGNPLKESFIAAAALLFRRGEIAPLPAATTLRLSKTAPLRASIIEREWAAANGGQRPDLLASRLLVAPDQDVQTSQVVQTAGSTGTSSARVFATAAGSAYLAQGQGALAVAGFVGGEKVASQAVNFDFPVFGNNYAALILSSADGKPLRNSGRLLLTIGGQAENIGMGWNETRTSVGNKWGTGPAQVEGIPAKVTLTNPLIQHVWALDATGARVTEVPIKREGERVTFSIGPEFRTICYEVLQ